MHLETQQRLLNHICGGIKEFFENSHPDDIDRTAPRFRLTTMPGEMDLSDTEIVQGQQSEGELFREALDTPTLKDFENPKIPIEPPQQKGDASPPTEQTPPRQRDEQGRFQKAEKGS